MKKNWIDISVPLRDGMVHWPGDPAVRIRKILSIRKGDAADVSYLSMGSHTGTHMDAPAHFISGKKTIDQMPFDATVGPARVIEIRDGQAVRAEELEQKKIQPRERILFKTRNSPRCWKSKKFVKDFVYISESAAKFLAQRRVRMVGVDYLSVGGFFDDGARVHRILLSAGIWIVEGLNMTGVAPGRHDLACLPLKILGGDGAPARAAIRKI